MSLQSKIALENNRKRIGGVEKVLIDAYKDGFLIARSQRESPEVDGSVLIDISDLQQTIAPQQLIGKFAAVCITGATEYDLMARLA